MRDTQEWETGRLWALLQHRIPDFTNTFKKCKFYRMIAHAPINELNIFIGVYRRFPDDKKMGYDVGTTNNDITATQRTLINIIVIMTKTVPSVY